jgi:predicted acyl esterase
MAGVEGLEPTTLGFGVSGPSLKKNRFFPNWGNISSFEINGIAQDSQPKTGLPGRRKTYVHLTRLVLNPQPLHLAGTPLVHLVASTSGTDSDWVVKLIDVYPEQYPQKPELGGYELAISMDIMRGRYRDDPAHPSPLPANQPVTYRFALPNVDYVVEPGHRLMVQVQSSWFPLYDRNPQTFVPNIMFAKASDYRAATQKVFTGGDGTWIGLPVVK